jgi:hypothetical protein
MNERAYTLPSRFSLDEYAMLVAMAGDMGVSRADVLRMALRQAYKARFGAAVPPPATPPAPRAKKKSHK